MPSVSVIVAARNACGSIGECLGSILAIRSPAFDVVVVNDASDDATGKLLERFRKPGRVTILTNPVQMGAAAARNLGASAVTSDLLFFTDSDCVVDPGWIAAGIAAFSDPEVQAAEGDICYAEPRPSIRHKVPVNPFQNLHGRPVLTTPGQDYAGGNLAVRRVAFEAVSGFDAVRYRLGREDTDFGYRVRRLGRIVHVPAMRVTHRAEYWTLASLLANADRYRADVTFFHDHGQFVFKRGPFLHPALLAMLVCPLVIPLRLEVRTLADLAFLPKLYLYLLRARFNIWLGSVREQVLCL